MSIEQTETTDGQAAARSVDDFLADLDAVLADSTAAPGPAADPDPAPDAAATMPDVDLSLEVASEDAAATAPDPAETSAPAVPVPSPDVEPVTKTPAAPPVAPAPRRPEPAPENWWDDVYKHDKADQDTFTGNRPRTAPQNGPALPPKPPLPPVVTSEQNVSHGAAVLVVEEEDEPSEPGTSKEDDSEEDPTPWAQKIWSLVKKDYDSRKPETAQKTNPPKNGLLNNPRGRKVFFAGTAYGMGWSLGLDDWMTGLLKVSDQYAIPVMGCVLCAGIVGLSMRNRFGGLVFGSSLALIAVLRMAGPDRFLGGSLILASHIAYRVVRGWTGDYGQQWPWKAIVWAAHIPAATATVAFLLHETN